MQEFIRRKDEQKPGLNLGLTLGNKPALKEVGIEIEVEGKNFLYHDAVPSPWKYVEDHSLRGDESAEYVLKKPIAFADVPKALETLFGALSENEASFDDSNRTSVHVHLNCQEFHLDRLTSFLSMWFALEEILTEWCGEYRVGNLFCLRAIDAPAIVTHIKKFIQSDGQYPFGETLRYGAINPHSLHKFGSLEIRTLQGCHEAKPIADWVATLGRLYNYSKEFDNPTELVDIFSALGPMAFFKKLLGDMTETVKTGSNMSDEDIVAAMFRGIRFAQHLAYCRDWSLYKPFEIKPCPFGRDIRKLVPKILKQEPPSEPAQSMPDFEPDFEPEYDPPSHDYDAPVDPLSQYFVTGAQAAAGLQQSVLQQSAAAIHTLEDFITPTF